VDNVTVAREQTNMRGVTGFHGGQCQVLRVRPVKNGCGAQNRPTHSGHKQHRVVVLGITSETPAHIMIPDGMRKVFIGFALYT
jgi:hypothetical protein